MRIRRFLPAMMTALVLPITMVAGDHSLWLDRTVSRLIPAEEEFSPSPVLRSLDGAAADLVTWTVSTDRQASVIRGVLQSTVESVVPYFDDVRLTVTRGSAEFDCGPFPMPTLLDNGGWRFWVYTAPLPRSGACANAESSELGAKGFRRGSDVKALYRP